MSNFPFIIIDSIAVEKSFNEIENIVKGQNMSNENTTEAERTVKLFYGVE